MLLIKLYHLDLILHLQGQVLPYQANIVTCTTVFNIRGHVLICEWSVQTVSQMCLMFVKG